MPFDRDRYDDLVKRAAFNAEYWRGTIQDQSPARRPMTYTGSPKWCRVGSLVALEKRAAADGTTSAVIPPILDVTGAVTFEALFDHATFPPNFLRQISGTGGFTFGNATGVDRVEAYLLDNAGAGARLVTVATSSVQRFRPSHVLLTSVNGGTAGVAWINGVPSAVVLALAGVAANGAAAALTTFSVANTGRVAITRCWQGALSSADATVLWEAARPR